MPLLPDPATLSHWPRLEKTLWRLNSRSSCALLERHVRTLSARVDSSKYLSLLWEECSRKNTPRICLLFSAPSLITIKRLGSLSNEPSSCHPAPCTVRTILSKAAPMFLQKAKSDHIMTPVQTIQWPFIKLKVKVLKMTSKALNELLPPLSLGHQTTSLIPALQPHHIPLTVAGSLFLDSFLQHQFLSEVSALTSFHTAPTPLSHVFLCFIWIQSGNHPVTYYMYNIYLLTCLNTVFATEIKLYGNDPIPVSWRLFQGTRKCLSDWKSSINIFWLLDTRSPGPWLLQPASDHVPSSEMPLQVASSNQAGDAFGRNRADTELNSWTRKDQKWERGTRGTGSMRQNWVCSLGRQGEPRVRGSHSPRHVFFSPRPLSFSSPSFFAL